MVTGQPFNPFGFFQNVLIPKAIAQRKELSASAKLLYGVLNSHCGKDGKVYPSQATLAEEIGVEEKSIQRTIQNLADVGLIRIVHPTGSDRLLHKHNQYVFLWHEWLEESSQMTTESSESAHPPSMGGPAPAPTGGANKTTILKQYPLRGAKPAAASPTNGNGAQTSHKFQRAFCRMWEDKYKRPYPFQAMKDGVAIKKMCHYLKGDRKEFKIVVARYLEKTGGNGYFNGHPAWKLSANIHEFLVSEEMNGDEDNGGVTITSKYEDEK